MATLLVNLTKRKNQSKSPWERFRTGEAPPKVWTFGCQAVGDVPKGHPNYKGLSAHGAEGVYLGPDLTRRADFVWTCTMTKWLSHPLSRSMNGPSLSRRTLIMSSFPHLVGVLLKLATVPCLFEPGIWRQRCVWLLWSEFNYIKFYFFDISYFLQNIF